MGSSGSLTRSRLGMGSEAGSGPNSPLRPASPAQSARSIMLAGVPAGLQGPTRSSVVARVGGLMGPQPDADVTGSADSSRRTSVDVHRLSAGPIAPHSPSRTGLAPSERAGSEHGEASPARKAPVVGFVPPPEVLGQAAPAIGFVPPPEIMAGAGSKQSDSADAPDGQRTSPSPPRADPRLVLNTHQSMPAKDRPAATMPLRTVETVRLRAESPMQLPPGGAGFGAHSTLLGHGPSRLGGGAGASGSSGSGAGADGEGALPRGRNGDGPRVMPSEADPDSPDVSSPMMGVANAGSKPGGDADGGAIAATGLLPNAPTGGFSFGINAHVFSSDSAAGTSAAQPGHPDPRAPNGAADQQHAEPAPRGWRIGAKMSDDGTATYVVGIAEAHPHDSGHATAQPAHQRALPSAFDAPPPFQVDAHDTPVSASGPGGDAQARARVYQPQQSASSMTSGDSLLTDPEHSHRLEGREKLPWEESSDDEAGPEGSSSAASSQPGKGAPASIGAGAAGSPPTAAPPASAAVRVPGSSRIGELRSQSLIESRSLPASFTLELPVAYGAAGAGHTPTSRSGSVMSQGEGDIVPAPSFNEYTRPPRPSGGDGGLPPAVAPAVAPQSSARVPRVFSARSGSSFSHDPAVSITITDADLARAGGMVPALLEVVRERFRQKGFQNLAQFAAGGASGSSGPHSPHEVSGQSLSPALSGETLAERIVARVETFHSARRGAVSEDLAAALMSVSEDAAKSDRATQTAGVATSAAASTSTDQPAFASQHSTAHAFFLATTVPLAAKQVSAGGAARDQLLHPDAATIRTAADFFRGAASRATINTSSVAAPARELPSGVSPTAAAALASSVGTYSCEPLGPPRGRNARDQLYLSTTPGTRSRRHSASGRPSSNGGVLVAARSAGGGRRVSAAGGGGRVVIDDEPVDLATYSSRSTPHYRRPSVGTSPAAMTGGIMRAQSGGSDAVPVVTFSSGPGGASGDGGRGLTREVLAHLAHLVPARHPFETTTDEEREEEERRARRRAKQKRASAAGTPRRSIGHLDDEGPTSSGPYGVASSAHSGRQTVRSQPWSRPRLSANGISPTASPSPHAHFEGDGLSSGGDGRGLMPRQLAAAMAEVDPLSGVAATESPATAAAPGDSIAVPPLSLDAPDMPGSGIGRAALGGGGASATAPQLPHETFFISSPRWRPNGPFADADDLAAAAASAGPSGRSGGRMEGAAAERGVAQQQGGAAAQPSRLVQTTTASTARRDGRRGQRSAANTISWDSSGSGDDADGTCGGSGRSRAQGRRPNSAGPGRGNRGGSKAPAGGDVDTAPPTRSGSGRRGGRRAPYWADEEDLDDPYGGPVLEPLDLDADPSALSNTSRGGASSAAASVLSQRRYVAAARAHRSVSEANSAKRLSTVLAEGGADPEGGSDSGGGGEGGDTATESGRRAGGSHRAGGDGDVASTGLLSEDARPGEEDGARTSGGSPRREGKRAGRLAWMQPAAFAEDDVAGVSTQAAASSSAPESEDGGYGLNGSGHDGRRTAAAVGRKGRLGAEAGEEGAVDCAARSAATPNSAHVRDSLQRLLDLRSQAREETNGRSIPPTPSAKQPARATPHASGAAKAPAGAKLSAVGRALGGLPSARSSRSPSEAATAGGTTEADRAAREALLPGAAGAAEAQPSPRNARDRPAAAALLAGGDSGDEPPQDPHALVSPKYTQDMAEEEYGWDVATGDADVDGVASPHGRRAHRAPAPRSGGRGTGAAQGAGAGTGGRRALPYDPSEVPMAGVNDASASYMRDLEQLELQEVVESLVGAGAAAAGGALLTSARSPSPQKASRNGASGRSAAGNAGSPASLTRTSLTSSAFNSALGNLLAGRSPAAAAPVGSSRSRADVQQPEWQVRLRQLKEQRQLRQLRAAEAAAAGLEEAAELEAEMRRRVTAGSPVGSSAPDPELRRLLLAAWSRWYLGRTAGSGFGAGPMDLNAEREAEAAMAAAEAQARLQLLAEAWTRSGAQAVDSSASSLAIQPPR
ncbi:hypothetical protein GPECTOR_1g560 [Gonium pectorale]|uniref:Uncharacterized protein n=1 Tax=Gonium pectorale TaxID=33097 RepID=A0A150H3M8_GONPE|nr:hypothetical protein GPECTOR_1g560 [Gonium pectorale]|eukprot:KXZ56622.1 hypothetical protein GPECTOR_1g560 [Gonium pectorale]